MAIFFYTRVHSIVLEEIKKHYYIYYEYIHSFFIKLYFIFLFDEIELEFIATYIMGERGCCPHLNIHITTTMSFVLFISCVFVVH